MTTQTHNNIINGSLAANEKPLIQNILLKNVFTSIAHALTLYSTNAILLCYAHYMHQ